MPTEKTQSEWDVIGKQVGTFVRNWHQHATSITRSGGWDEIAKSIATNFNEDEESRNINNTFTAQIQQTISNENSRKNAVASLFQSYARVVLKDFLESKNTRLLTNRFDEFGDNEQTGLLKDLQVAMRNNVSTQQYFLQHTVSYGIPTSFASNVHSGTTTAIITNLSVTQMTRTQRLTLTCTDETIGGETFELSGDITGAERTAVQIDTSYFGYRSGINLEIERQQEEFNDSSNQLGWLETDRNEDGSNTDTTSNKDAMRLHFIIWNNHAGSNEIRVYSASSDIMHTNLATNIVMIGTGTNTEDPISLVASNGSGLNATIDVPAGAAFIAATNIYYDLLRFRLDDAYTINTTRSVEGRFQKFFTDALGIPMNAGTNSQVTLPETFAGVS